LFDLAKGATKSIEVKYNVQDPSGGAIVGQTATIVVTGVNDLPTVSNLTPETREIVETPNVSNSSMPHVLNGTFKVSDTDTPLGQLILKPGVASSSLGSFEFFSINATDGSVAWRYSIADSALDTLSAGNKLTVSKQFSIEDGVDVFSSSVDVLLIGSDTTTL
jgi:VCBS repeat-containing protein